MKKIFTAGLLLGLVSLTILCGLVSAQEDRKLTPTVIEGGKIATPEEVKGLITNKSVFFFDLRKSLNYGKGHIPSAVSLPYEWTSKDALEVRTGTFDMTKLPPDKNATIVFYSDGPSGWKSYRAAPDTIKAGYKNVVYFREGFAVWESKGYPIER